MKQRDVFSYQEALEAIASLQPRGWRLGLDRMQRFCEAAGLQTALGFEGSPNYIHVAGTNGKGSTTAFLQYLLTAQGYRTGSFFSPYIISPRERVQMNLELISEGDLARLTNELWPIQEAFESTEFHGITEFEFKTAIGFKYWQENQCDWVALEVGLGGRLDSTNVVMPKCSIIVSIGLDHVQILGETHGKIAYEKAGIIKPGVPAVMGLLNDEARGVVRDVVAANGSALYELGRDILVDRQAPDRLLIKTPFGSHVFGELGIPGFMQDENLALAVTAIEAAGAMRNPDLLAKAARSASIPGRFQRLHWNGTSMILDGSHNQEAGAVLRRSLRDAGIDQVHLVTNMLRGHEPEAFYRELTGLVASVQVVPIAFPRAIPALESAAVLQGLFSDVQIRVSILEGLTEASGPASDETPVLVTGSNYLVGEAAQVLGLTS